ncbi:hypothetical protein Glove_33g279 [Diversispora epigaea]|uniref:TLDc domain-containing protein n=1 Tax=Diversispora epigaea TaxID=1348612 RepID=A0A397JH20_9GLOM|nr:hypothetical protein Glove_33g279 [Diversispora epigaea]
MFLKYVYGGIVNLEKVETRFIFDLMLIANEFEPAELSNKLETILIEDKAFWLKTHFSFVYRTIFVKENFKKLENFCNDIVVKYPNLIFDSSDFTSLQESALVSLLKRDDLQMKEVEIWDYVIKWGIIQNPTLPTNLGDWTKENFLTLKATLQQCLPHIRYFHITNIEIYERIRPSAPDRTIILPAQSVLNTELPPRTTEPFSTIISEDHVAKISSWINRKTATYSTKKIPYKFELILCGTRDGFAPQTFWNICHGHACTIVVAKVKGTDEIIGGYNPLAWDNTLNGNSNIRMETPTVQYSVSSFLNTVINPNMNMNINIDPNLNVINPGTLLSLNNNNNNKQVLIKKSLQKQPQQQVIRPETTTTTTNCSITITAICFTSVKQASKKQDIQYQATQQQQVSQKKFLNSKLLETSYSTNLYFMIIFLFN